MSISPAINTHRILFISFSARHWFTEFCKFLHKALNSAFFVPAILCSKPRY
ncbi:hypothetical protein [Morganella psychrotolerans]|uniref:hypothetical protein n=1 Tax=Morganella psychrotolerans TaxID=368603 RepID=UPI003CD0B4C6